MSYSTASHSPAAKVPAAKVPDWPGLDHAREIAGAYGARTVGTQHLLLALLAATDDETRRALRGGGVDDRSVAVALQAITGVGARPETVPVAEVTVSERVRTILAAAGRRTDRTSERERAVDDRDVLGALLASDEPTVARLIVTYIGARRQVIEALDARPTALTAAAPS